MKKLFERIAYTLFGAILVCVAHYIGSTDNKADAQFTTFEDVEITGRLYVKDEITVGDRSASHGNFVFIKADDKDTILMLLHNFNRVNETSDARVLLTATGGNDRPSAGITLKDKFGNKSLASSYVGWIDPSDIPE